MATDTSSEAAAATPVVEPAAVAVASRSVEPIPARSPAATVTNSGVVTTNDTTVSLRRGLWKGCWQWG